MKISKIYILLAFQLSNTSLVYASNNQTKPNKCFELLQIKNPSPALSEKDAQQMNTFLDALRRHGPDLFDTITKYFNFLADQLHIPMNHSMRDEFEKDFKNLQLAAIYGPIEIRQNLRHLQMQIENFVFTTAYKNELQGRAANKDPEIRDKDPQKWGERFARDLAWRIRFEKAFLKEATFELQAAYAHTKSVEDKKSVLSALHSLARSEPDFVSDLSFPFVLQIARTEKNTEVISEAIGIVLEQSNKIEQRKSSLLRLLDENVANPYVYGKVAELRYPFHPHTPAEAQEYKAWRKKVLEAAVAGRFDSHHIDNAFYIMMSFVTHGDLSEIDSLKSVATHSKNAEIRGQAIRALMHIYLDNAPQLLAKESEFLIERLHHESLLAPIGKAFHTSVVHICEAIKHIGLPAKKALPDLLHLLNLQVQDKNEVRILISSIEAVTDHKQAEGIYKDFKKSLAIKLNIKPRDFVFSKITTTQLESKIKSLWKKYDYYDESDHIAPFHLLSVQLEKDLSTVQFDTENMSSEDLYGDGSFPIGYHTLENGMSFLGVNAGGDWENPLFFIVYWDGQDLRAYIPEDGNPWNTDTHKAYGNDDENDEQNDRINAKKRYPEYFKNMSVDEIDMRDHRISGNEAKILNELRAKFK